MLRDWQKLTDEHFLPKCTRVYYVALVISPSAVYSFVLLYWIFYYSYIIRSACLLNSRLHCGRFLDRSDTWRTDIHYTCFWVPYSYALLFLIFSDNRTFSKVARHGRDHVVLEMSTGRVDPRVGSRPPDTGGRGWVGLGWTGASGRATKCWPVDNYAWMRGADDFTVW